MDATDERVRRDAALERAQGAIDRILGVAPDEDHARFYLMIHPVDPEGALRTWCTTGTNFQDLVPRMAQAALAVRTKLFDPDLGQNTRRRAIGWSIGARSAGLGLAQAQLVDLEARPDGTGRLFSGRVGERSSGQSGTRLLLFEDALVGLARRAFAALGALYKAAAYSGPVDVGVAVLGLEGRDVVSESNLNDRRPREQRRVPLPSGEDYRDTERVGAEDLRARTDSVARRLLMPLIQATAPGYDPFE